MTRGHTRRPVWSWYCDYCGRRGDGDLLQSTIHRYAMAIGARISHTVEADPEVTR